MDYRPSDSVQFVMSVVFVFVLTKDIYLIKGEKYI